jgi:hypothetical protein
MISSNDLIESDENKSTLKLTPSNVFHYIGHNIIFKTRGQTIVKKIISVSDTGKTIYIDHPDLQNQIQIVTRNVYVIT